MNIHTQKETHKTNHNSWLHIQVTAIAVKQTAYDSMPTDDGRKTETCSGNEIGVGEEELLRWQTIIYLMNNTEALLYYSNKYAATANCRPFHMSVIRVSYLTYSLHIRTSTPLCTLTSNPAGTFRELALAGWLTATSKLNPEV
jgi:hypothetical protein